MRYVEATECAKLYMGNCEQFVYSTYETDLDKVFDNVLSKLTYWGHLDIELELLPHRKGYPKTARHDEKLTNINVFDCIMW